MHIYPKYTGPIRPDSTRTSETADAPESAPISPAAPSTSNQDRADKVEISDAGRALAARGGDASSGLDPARAERIRGRILSGAYDTLEVVDAVARRLIDSGDL
jgi:anti-sigma28 factor (negative regulator of flagellin synthesis)